MRTKSDIKKLRKTLDVPASTPMVVSHNKLPGGRALLWDAEYIPNHHIVSSSGSNRVALLTRHKGIMIPLLYSSEPLLNRET